MSSKPYDFTTGGSDSRISASDISLQGVGGAPIHVIGKTRVNLEIEGKCVETDCYILPSISRGIDMLIGDPALRMMARNQELRVRYDDDKSSATIGHVETTRQEPEEIIEDHDMTLRKFRFKDRFMWEYEWKWKADPPLPNLNRVAPIYWKRFDRDEVNQVIAEWAERSLEPCSEPKFCIPINPVEQDKPGHPIRVTGDFEKFNKHIKSASTEESNEVCSKAIRAIRSYDSGTFLDLSKAYQSVSLAPELRNYNAFRIGDKWYRSTQMLFGIAIGQKVLYRILTQVLENKSINFRDDIFIPNGENEREVVNLLEENGFNIKQGSLWHLQELNEDPKRILGLEVFRCKNKLWWQRPKLNLTTVETARDLAKVLGQAASSHLPCVGKARAQVALLRSLLGSHIGGAMEKWNQKIPDTFLGLWNLAQTELMESRPYEWLIPNTVRKFVLYTDASKFLAGGVIRAITVTEVESDDLLDFCRVHYEQHINIRELDAIIWGLQALEDIAPKGVEIEIVTDSKSGYSWTYTAITDGIIRTKALYKSLIKSRIDIIKETLRINQWRTTIRWVESKENPADALTRVPPKFREVWRTYHQSDDDADSDEEVETIGVVQCLSLESHIKQLHHAHLHPGEYAMMKIMRDAIPNPEPRLAAAVKRIIKQCVLCRRKRPANKYVNLKMDNTKPEHPWQWVQIDTLSVSHLPNVKVIILLDEYSRFTEYQGISSQPKAEDTIRLLEAWYHRYRPTEWHIRLDRGREFFNTMVATWIRDHNGKAHYSSVRRPTACGMVERVNRSILQIMKIAKHEYPDKPISEIIRMSMHEYWNRPHRALLEKRPNEAVRAQRRDTSQTAVSSGEDDDGELPCDNDSDVWDSSSEDEGQPVGESEGFRTPRSDDHPIPGERVLIYDPAVVEKLELPWTPATVVEQKGSATVVRPDGPGRHEVTLNQRWIQSLSPASADMEEEPSEVPGLIQIETANEASNTTEEVNAADQAQPSMLRRSRRKPRPPERYRSD